MSNHDTRAFTYLYTVFSRQGKLDTDRLRTLVDSDNHLDKHYATFVSITGSPLDKMVFKRHVGTLIQKYLSRDTGKTVLNSRYNDPDTDKRLLTIHNDHDYWLKRQVMPDLVQTLGNVDYDFLKSPNKRKRNMDLVPVMTRVFDAHTPYFVTAHGSHSMTSHESMVLPMNTAIIFFKSLGLQMYTSHIDALINNFKNPEFVRQICTNPGWKLTSRGDDDAFRNRTYFPPGAHYYQAFLNFKHEVMWQNGMYDVYDKDSGEIKLPNDVNMYRNGKSHKLNLIPQFYPHAKRNAFGDVTGTILLSDLVKRVSERGGGILAVTHCRNDLTGKRSMVHPYRKLNKWVYESRRRTVDNQMKVNIGKMYLTTETPVIRVKGLNMDIPVSVDYARSVLYAYHLGKSTSKKFGGYVNERFRFADDDKVVLYFTRTPESTGPSQDVCMSMSGDATSKCRFEVSAKRKRDATSMQNSFAKLDAFLMYGKRALSASKP